jgi:hypothetical protein
MGSGGDMTEVEYRPITELLGATAIAVEVNDDADELTFVLNSGARITFFHEQDCCEDVAIVDICGDLSDLVGAPITLAEEAVKTSEDDERGQTWTFYRFAAKGHVTVRWLGESNGYYSESVDMRFDVPDESWRTGLPDGKLRCIVATDESEYSYRSRERAVATWVPAARMWLNERGNPHNRDVAKWFPLGVT